MEPKRQYIECEAISVGRASMAHRIDGRVVPTDEPAVRGGTDFGPPPFDTRVSMIAGCKYASMSLILADRSATFERMRIHLRTQVDPGGVFGIAKDVLPISLIEKTGEPTADIRGAGRDPRGAGMALHGLAAPAPRRRTKQRALESERRGARGR